MPRRSAAPRPLPPVLVWHVLPGAALRCTSTMALPPALRPDVATSAPRSHLRFSRGMSCRALSESAHTKCPVLLVAGWLSVVWGGAPRMFKMLSQPPLCEHASTGSPAACLVAAQAHGRATARVRIALLQFGRLNSGRPQGGSGQFFLCAGRTRCCRWSRRPRPV